MADVQAQLHSANPNHRARGLRHITERPHRYVALVARVEELLDDDACAILSIPIVYGEVRFAAAHALAQLRAATGDPRPVVVQGVGKPLTGATLGALRAATDLPLMGSIQLYQELRALGQLPTRNLRVEPIGLQNP